MKYTLLNRRSFDIYILDISPGTPPTATVTRNVGEPVAVSKLSIDMDNEAGYQRCSFSIDTEKYDCSVISAVEDCVGDTTTTTIIHTSNPTDITVLSDAVTVIADDTPESEGPDVDSGTEPIS